MIPKRELENLVSSLRRQWEPGSGVFVVLEGKNGDSMRITVDCLLNRLVAENCRIWKGSDLVYTGSLTASSLRAATRGITAYSAEMFIIRNKSHQARRLCRWDLRNRGNVESATVQRTSTGVRGGSHSQ